MFSCYFGHFQIWHAYLNLSKIMPSIWNSLKFSHDQLFAALKENLMPLPLYWTEIDINSLFFVLVITSSVQVINLHMIHSLSHMIHYLNSVMQKKKNFWISFGVPSRKVPMCKKKHLCWNFGQFGQRLEVAFEL